MALHNPLESPGTQFKRSPDLAPLIGVPDIEAEDYSLTGRLSIIAKLKAARRIEVARGQAKSWLYDINRHLSLCAALRAEYEALGAFIAREAGDEETGAFAKHSLPEVQAGFCRDLR